MIDRYIVSAFLKHQDKILLLRRSEKVTTYPGKWGVVAGSINQGEDPEKRARIEIEEEAGIKDTKLMKKVKQLLLVDKKLNIKWHIYPFLFEVKSDKIKINWENSDFKWIKPENIKNIDTVPSLYREYKLLTR